MWRCGRWGQVHLFGGPLDGRIVLVCRNQAEAENRAAALDPVHWPYGVGLWFSPLMGAVDMDDLCERWPGLEWVYVSVRPKVTAADWVAMVVEGCRRRDVPVWVEAEGGEAWLVDGEVVQEYPVRTSRSRRERFVEKR